MRTQSFLYRTAFDTSQHVATTWPGWTLDARDILLKPCVGQLDNILVMVSHKDVIQGMFKV